MYKYLKCYVAQEYICNSAYSTRCYTGILMSHFTLENLKVLIFNAYYFVY